MIIDAHIHAFPHQGSAAGYPDAAAHLKVQQSAVKMFWGRMVSSTMDPQYIPEDDEDVNFEVGRYGRWLWTKNGQDCWFQRYSPILAEMEWTPEQMVAFMDSVGVDKGVLQSGYMEENFGREYFADCVRRWPDRFIGTIAIDYDIAKSPSYRENELEKLRNAVAGWGCRGVFQGFPRAQPMDDPAFDPLWKELSRLNIPHIFFMGFQPKQVYLESLARLERVVNKFDGLTAVIGHLGGNARHPKDPNFTNTPYDLMNILKRPNVYFEVGYVLAYEHWEIWKENYEYPFPLHNAVIRNVYDEIGAGRLLWGSDMPHIYRICTYKQILDLVRLHLNFMNEEEKAQVLGLNAARVFKA